MNKDIYLGIFFGGALMSVGFALLGLWKLESIAVLTFYVILAVIIWIHAMIDNLREKDKQQLEGLE